MRNIIIIAVYVLQTISISAQSIKCADDLKKFYIDYFTYSVDSALEIQFDSVVVVNCTKDFYDAWHEDMYEIGSYDPLTEGAGGTTKEDLFFTINSIVIEKEEDYYVASFAFHDWLDNSVAVISVIVYINEEGKIRCTKRPSDGYVTP